MAVGMLQPLQAAAEDTSWSISISAAVCYAVIAVLRMGSYAVSWAIYCSTEPSAKGWSGCFTDPPTLSTVSAYNGAHGAFRCCNGIVCVIPHVLMVWLCLRWVYCDLLDPPPLPIIFSASLGIFCLLDFLQVVTAHSTEHWVIAHIFFASMIITFMLFFHGVLSRPGVRGEGNAYIALPIAAALFLGVVGTCAYMLCMFEFDQNQTLEAKSWVVVEYITATLVIGMHVCLGICLPSHLKVCLRSPVAVHLLLQGSPLSKQSPTPPPRHPHEQAFEDAVPAPRVQPPATTSAWGVAQRTTAPWNKFDDDDWVSVSSSQHA